MKLMIRIVVLLLIQDKDDFDMNELTVNKYALLVTLTCYYYEI